MSKSNANKDKRPPAEPYFASAKSTGGGGFNHEDEVVAYFLAHLLTGRPFGPDAGVVVRVNFQARTDDWLFDDAVLTLRTPLGDQHCAASIKSNRQFAEDHAAPAGFVHDAWTQYLGGPPMNRDKDHLLLAVSALPADVLQDFNELRGLADATDPNTLAGSLDRKGFADDGKRRMHESLACPKDVAAKFNAGDVPTARLIARLLLMDFDFPSATSRHRAEAIQLCRDPLMNPSAELSTRLWEDLCRIARDMRPHKGMLDFGRLLMRLRGRYDLRVYPDHQADWAKLDRHTQAEFSKAGRWSLGGRLSLTRPAIRRAIEELNDSQILAFVGDSGDGKSVCCRQWAGGGASRIWLDARLFDATDGRNSIAVLEERLGLKNSVQELLRSAAGRRPRLAIDGVGRLYDDTTLAAAATLAHAAVEAGWEVALTCQNESWERVAVTFGQAGLAPGPVRVGPLRRDELAAVALAEPRVAVLLAQPEIRPVLSRPKYLDVLLQNLPAGTAVEAATSVAWTGEADVATWCWQRVVEGSVSGLTRSAAAKHLASVQADLVRDSVAEDQIEPAHLPAIEALQRDGLCRKVGERIVFDHDLIADWGRARVLLGRTGDLIAFLKQHNRTASPLWTQALRLWALDVLERQDDLQKWIGMAKALTAAGEPAAADRILEAVLLSTRSETLLERAWPLLAADGELLQRALESFLHTATVPAFDTQRTIAQVAGGKVDVGLATWAAANLRVPMRARWIVVLPVLHRHRDDAARLAPLQAAKISRLWLQFTATDMPRRLEAAGLALAVGWRVHAALDDDRQPLSLPGEPSSWSLYRDAEQEAYTAALAAARVMPSETIEFALDAVGRRGGRILELGETYDPQWPLGPVRDVSVRFQQVVLEDASFLSLVDADPNAAAEVLLAALIESPSLRTFPGMLGQSYDDDRELSITHIYGWVPAFYTRGPFLAFLRAAPESAIEAILELINFATERWVERETRHVHGLRAGPAPPQPVPIQIDDRPPVEWLGGVDVYRWHSGDVTAPLPVMSSLMAMERWLYERLDAGEDIAATLEEIISRSRSVAVAGMLATVGRYRQQLLLGPLKCLLNVPEFLLWEPHRRPTSLGANLAAMGFPMRADQFSAETFQEWFAMPHRQLSFNELSYFLFLNTAELRDSMSAAVPKWRAELARDDLSTERRTAIQDYVDAFDLDHWEKISLTDGQQYWKRKVSAEDAKASRAALRQADNTILAISFPHHCREILDGKVVLDDAAIEILWANLNRVADLLDAPAEPDEPDTAGIRRLIGQPAAAWRYESALAGVYGGIAAFLLRHADWLTKRRDRRASLLRLLRRTASRPLPAINPMDASHPDETSSDRWQCFYAELVVYFWRQKPASKQWRYKAAAVLGGFHYSPVRHLFIAATACRTDLQGGFESLGHFLLRWAGVRWHAELARNQWPIAVDIRAEGGILLEAFVNGKLQPQWPTCGVAAEAPVELPDRETPPPRWRRGLDLMLIAVSLSGLLRPADATSADERRRWIGFWLDLTDWRISKLSHEEPNNKTERPSDGHPSESDDWLLSRLADVTLAMRHDEQPDAAWKPLMDFVTINGRWVESYLTSFLIQGLTAESTPSAFASRWLDMIRYAEASSQWPSAGDEVWSHLLGFDRLIQRAWDPRHADLRKTLSPHVISFLRDRLSSARGLRDLMNWLTKWSLEPIWLGLLKPCADAIVATPHWLDSKDTSGAVAGWIGGLIEHHASDVRNNPDLFDAAMRVLATLANVREPIARELQNRLRGT